MCNRAAVYLKTAAQNIAFVCKIMEGYEHLGVVTTIDRYEGVLMIRSTPDTRIEVIKIIQALPVDCLILDKY